MKFNRMYIMAKNVNADYCRSKAIDNYQRQEKMEQINKKMNKIDKIMLEKQFHNEERQYLEEQLSEEKENMLKRLAEFLHSEKSYSKEEIYKFVFDGKKPGEKIKDNKKSENNDEKEEENNNNVASVIQNF